MACFGLQNGYQRKTMQKIEFGTHKLSIWDQFWLQVSNASEGDIKPERFTQ